MSPDEIVRTSELQVFERQLYNVSRERERREEEGDGRKKNSTSTSTSTS